MLSSVILKVRSAVNLGFMRPFLSRAVTALVPPWGFWKAAWRDERASIAPMVAVLSTVLIGAAALAIDVGIWENNVSTMQGAADQAALAASRAMSAGAASAQKEAKGVAAAHGFVDGTGNVTVTPNIPPKTGGFASNANAIEVVITQPQTMFLSGVRLQSAPVASVRAVAAPTMVPTCLLLLKPTQQGIVNNSSGGVDASSCNVYVNSKDPCDVIATATSSVIGLDVFLGEPSQDTYCSRGAPPATAKNAMHYSAPPASDPYASRTIPKPSGTCQSTTPNNGHLDPGTYCSDLVFNGSQSITLNDGVYIFNGVNLSLYDNAQISGSNVSLVFTGSGSKYGTLAMGGSSNATLAPWQAGDTAGIAIWIDKAGAMDMGFYQHNSSSITGAVYAPASRVAWAGDANSGCTQLIASLVAFSGSAIATFKHDCSNVTGIADVASAAGYKLSE